MLELRQIVKDQIANLGPAKASEFFGVSQATIANWSNGKTEPSLKAVQLAIEASGLYLGKPEDAGEEVKLEQWAGKDLIVLTPVYRTFSADTHYTLFANYARYGLDKIGLIQEKRTVIHESRNILIHKAMRTEANWFVFVDDDMILPCGSAELFIGRYGAKVSKFSASLNAFSRLMSHPQDKLIVGSLYFGRHAKGHAQCASGFTSSRENEKLHKLEYKGLKTEDWVGTGCMKIHRSVIEKMKQEIDAGKWPECKPSKEGMWYGYFNPLRVGVGEDVSFCRRAGEIGIQTYLDTELICLHTGECNYGNHNTSY